MYLGGIYHGTWARSSGVERRLYDVLLRRKAMSGA
jgi:hypothetical protein